jgi:hypothetical protein
MKTITTCATCIPHRAYLAPTSNSHKEHTRSSIKLQALNKCTISIGFRCSPRSHCFRYERRCSKIDAVSLSRCSPRSHCFRYERRCSKIDAVSLSELLCKRGLARLLLHKVQQTLFFGRTHTRSVDAKGSQSRLPARLYHPTPVVVVHNTQ